MEADSVDTRDPDRQRLQMRLQKITARPSDHTEHPGESGGSEDLTPPENPFAAVQTDKPLVAIRGKRNGYVTLAPSREIRTYGELPDSIFLAAKAWAATLEAMGSPRVYWITLSEVVPHLHIHLYPRWPEDTLKGVALFEARNHPQQPGWAYEINAALQEWALNFDVEIIHTPS